MAGSERKVHPPDIAQLKEDLNKIFPYVIVGLGVGSLGLLIELLRNIQSVGYAGLPGLLFALIHGIRYVDLGNKIKELENKKERNKRH